MNAQPNPTPAAGGPPHGPTGAVPDDVPEVLTFDQVEAWARSARYNANGLRDHALIWTLYGTGARVSEVLAANIGSFLRLDQLRVPNLKRKRKKLGYRNVPMPARAREALINYLTTQRPGWEFGKRREEALFHGAQGGRLDRKVAWRSLKQAGLAAGLRAELVHPHTLRHTCATHLVESGVPLRHVQAWLGHTKVTTTEIYTHVAIGQLQQHAEDSHPAGRR